MLQTTTRMYGQGLKAGSNEHSRLEGRRKNWPEHLGLALVKACRGLLFKGPHVVDHTRLPLPSVYS
jgi:hypothetical protein